MVISNRLATIPDSYFGKTMGRKVEHGSLPLINMAVGIPDGETPKGIIDHFSEALRIPENQKYGAFHGKESFKEAIVNFMNDNMVSHFIKTKKFAFYMALKWFSCITNVCSQSWRNGAFTRSRIY